MAGIQDYLNQIKNAIYGKDVRQAIHDGIQQCYYDGKAGSTDLEARHNLDSVKARVMSAESNIEVLDARVDQIVAPSGEAPSAAEVSDARVGADGVIYSSLGDANRTQFSNLYKKTNIIDVSKRYTTNSAITYNGDGTYTVGTTDYGRTFFGTSDGSAIHLDAGIYNLFGVSEGFTFISTTANESSAIAMNTTGGAMGVVIDTAGDYYVGFRVSSTPSESFIITPFLKKVTPKVDGVSERVSILEETYYVLTPSGDTTNRALEIASILAEHKAIYFTEGEYTISSKLTLPSGSRLMGAGKSSVLKFADGVIGQMIECGNDCQISNLKFDGGLTSKPSDNSANRHGIRVLDNAQTLQIHDCFITGFGGTGIRVDSTGYAQLSSIQVVNCYINYCGTGIFFLEHGEYGLVSNCSIIDNYYGLMVYGGNNIVSGCGIERNTVGAIVNGQTAHNSGHGAFVGCSFNHNTSHGLQIRYTNNGYVVNGCQFYQNDGDEYRVSDATGITISGCTFGVSSSLHFDVNSTTLLTGCMFASRPTTTHMSRDTSKSFWINCYTFSGNGTANGAERLDVISRNLEYCNSKNILPEVDLPSTTDNGITYSMTNGVLTISGTTTQFTGILIAGNTLPLPTEWKAGDKVFVHLSDEPVEDVYLQVYTNVPDVMLCQTRTWGWFTVPADVSTMRFRVIIGSGRTINHSFYPSCSHIMTNGIEQAMITTAMPLEIPSMLTLIDDDGHVDFYNDVLPIIKNKKVPISSALIVSEVGETENKMTWEQIEDAYANGAEFLSHTFDHNTDLDGMSVEDIAYGYEKAKNIMNLHGLTGGKYLVFPGASQGYANAQKAAKRVYELGINSAGNRVNQPDIDKYNIRRYRIESDYGYGLDQLKALIDECLDTGGWMVWMFHTSDEAWSAGVASTLESCIDYAITRGLPIVNVDYAYRNYFKNR